MLPTTLLADPVVRFAGARFGAHERRGQRIATNRRVSRNWLAVAAVLAIAFAGMGYLGTWPPLATVMSASMEPTIKTGDIVVLKKLDRAPRVGDVVAVSVPPSIRTRFGYPPVIIHRIIRIDSNGVVSTKGDAFKDPDPFDVPSSALNTKVVATVPAAGRVFAFLGSTLGLLWLAGGALLLIGMPLLEHFRSGQRRGLDERDGVRALLQSVTEELALLRVERDRDLDAAALQAAEREQDRAAERDRELQAAAAAQEQLRAVNAAVSRQLEQLPAQIERAIAAAIAARPPAPPPPPPPPRVVLQSALGCVPASQWRPPTPDVMAMLRPAKTPSEIFRLPADFVPALTR
jgi:signal peptidase I